MRNPYHKPKQVDRCDCTKANGWFLAKELGKTEAVTLGYGLPAHNLRLRKERFGIKDAYASCVRDAAKDPWRLFIKNTALR